MFIEYLSIPILCISIEVLSAFATYSSDLHFSSTLSLIIGWFVRDGCESLFDNSSLCMYWWSRLVKIEHFYEISKTFEIIILWRFRQIRSRLTRKLITLQYVSICSHLKFVFNKCNCALCLHESPCVSSYTVSKEIWFLTQSILVHFKPFWGIIRANSICRDFFYYLQALQSYKS